MAEGSTLNLVITAISPIILGLLAWFIARFVKDFDATVEKLSAKVSNLGAKHSDLSSEVKVLAAQLAGIKEMVDKGVASVKLHAVGMHKEAMAIEASNREGLDQIGARVKNIEFQIDIIHKKIRASGLDETALLEIEKDTKEIKAKLSNHSRLFEATHSILRKHDEAMKYFGRVRWIKEDGNLRPVIPLQGQMEEEEEESDKKEPTIVKKK